MEISHQELSVGSPLFSVSSKIKKYIFIFENLYKSLKKILRGLNLLFLNARHIQILLNSRKTAKVFSINGLSKIIR